MTTFTGHLTDAQAQRLVDGVLGDAEAAEVVEHARCCAECDALVESYRVMCCALDDLEVPAPPPDFTCCVLDRIDEDVRAAARERRFAAAIFAAVAVAMVASLVAAGPGALAPAVSRAFDGLGEATRVLRIGAGFVPALVGALRLQIVLAAAAFALPLLLALARLMPAPRAETA